MTPRQRDAVAPLVSVIAICFNHERFVVPCLDSIAAQTYPNLQVIVLDDHSSDGSLAAINAWVEGRGAGVTLITHDVNRGICASRNEALALARGDYLAFISTDDQWLPEKIAVQVSQLEREPGSGAVAYGDALLMDEAGRPVPGRFIARNRAFERLPEGRVFEDLLLGNFIPSLATLVRRRCIEAVGGFDESLIYEDWDMWLRLSRRYRFAVTPAVVARYRIVAGSLIDALHGARRAEFFDSSLRLIAKQVGVSEEGDRRIRFRMHELSHALGMLDDPGYLAFVARLA